VHINITISSKTILLSFNIIKAPTYTILGLNWLIAINPTINWTRNYLEIENEVIRFEHVETFNNDQLLLIEDSDIPQYYTNFKKVFSK
jgi:hypothetical protein